MHEQLEPEPLGLLPKSLANRWRKCGGDKCPSWVLCAAGGVQGMFGMVADSSSEAIRAMPRSRPRSPGRCPDSQSPQEAFENCPSQRAPPVHGEFSREKRTLFVLSLPFVSAALPPPPIRRVKEQMLRLLDAARIGSDSVFTSRRSSVDAHDFNIASFKMARRRMLLFLLLFRLRKSGAIRSLPCPPFATGPPSHVAWG
ncbi:hypothetical protein ACJZ2D_011882 [Fusarium nematophilum]